MRAHVIDVTGEWEDGVERKLNAWLSEATPVKVHHVTASLTSSTKSVLVIFYDESAAAKAQSSGMCAQCRKQPPVAGIKVCAECQKYQKEYREKRKAHKRTPYP